MVSYRARPHWRVLVLQQGIGFLAGCKALHGLANERWKLYSGEFYPWSRQVDALGHLPAETYWAVLALELALVALWLLRLRPRLVAWSLTVVFGLDTLVSLQNHRLLLTLMLLLVALKPVPVSGDRRDHAVYWNVDLLAWLISIVYAVTALHKLAHPDFMSGEALRSLFAYVQHQDPARTYPGWLFAALQDMRVCQGLSIATVVVEVVLAIVLHLRRAAGWAIPVAVGMHLGFALLMPHIEIFSAMMILAQIAFLPTRIPAQGGWVLRRGAPEAGPRRFLRLVWPGYLTEEERAEPGWSLVRPDGEVLEGYAAWVELAGLSPLLFLPAETAQKMTRVQDLVGRWV